MSVSSSAQRQGPGPSKESRATARQAVRMPQTFRICHFPGNCSPPSSPLTPVLSLPEEEGCCHKQQAKPQRQQKGCGKPAREGKNANERREEEQGASVARYFFGLVEKAGQGGKNASGPSLPLSLLVQRAGLYAILFHKGSHAEQERALASFLSFLEERGLSHDEQIFCSDMLVYARQRDKTAYAFAKTQTHSLLRERPFPLMQGRNERGTRTIASIPTRQGERTSAKTRRNQDTQLQGVA